MYEYRVLEAEFLINQEQLNKLASEGWRLVTIIDCAETFYFYFERELDG